MSNRKLVRRLVLLLPALLLLLTASSAWAAGRVQWKSKSFKERSDKSWMLELAIYLPSAPDVAYVPMKFEFQPEVYYERALLDGHDGPVERNVPLEGRQPLIESVDVGFMDTSTTKIESRTRFSFKVRRDLGYEAGEYKVTVRDTRNGRVVGTPTTITFDGENEVIDRRAMVFSGEKKKDKPKADADKQSDSGSADKSSDSGDKDADKSDDKADDDKADDDKAEGNEPPPVEKKAGGCSCRVPARSQAGGFAWLLPLGLGLGLAGRRRRRV